MDEEEKKKAEQEQAGQKTAHVAGKAAATYFGGPLGNKIYNVASNTKAGQAIENTAGKVINAAPGMRHMTNAANKTGALDVADKGIDSASGSMSKGGLPKETLAKEGLEEKAAQAKQAQAASSSNNANTSGKFGTDDTSSSGGEGEGSSSRISFSSLFKWISLISSPLSGCGCLFGLIIIVIGAFAATLTGVLNFFDGIFDTLAGDALTEQAELHYYKKLEEAQQNAFAKYGVCIDVNLIHATLIAGRYFDDELEEGMQECEDLATCDLSSKDVIQAGEYRKMEKYIDTLANMQIKRKKYGLFYANKPECYTEYQKVYNDQCSDTNVSHSVLVQDEEGISATEKARQCMNINIWGDIATFFNPQENFPVQDSTTPRLVARNDKNKGFFAFFTKKANQERNYEYYYYIPAATFEDRDEDGEEERYCEEENLVIPESYNEYAGLSIGDWQNMENSVYFWNLLDSFVEDYYNDYLDKGSDYAEPGSKRYEDALEIIDRIYDVYTIMGPSRSCSGSYGDNVCAEETIQATCANGVTVTGKNAGTYDLETYIAGVVDHENAYKSKNGSIESAKAQAIAARTYLLATTNYCQKSIANSQSAQTFSKNPSSVATQAAQLTKGLILTNGGKIFATQYDSYCYQDKDCPDSTCVGDTCSVTYTKLPNGEKHTISLPKSRWSGWFVPGGGHARGMSQLVANNMADEGYSYKEILEYFYSDGTVVTAMIDGENSEEADLICRENENGTIGTGSQIPPGQTYDTFNGDVLVEWARKYVGNPYVWGGTSLTNGADCSGFVLTLVKELFDINLPHSSRLQVNYGTPVASLEEAQPGDLLFYSNQNGIYHVAIYAGDGKRVHAWSSKTGIVENNVGNPSYIRRLG